jgi:nucleotide-binding universal stress UspA family protein
MSAIDPSIVVVPYDFSPIGQESFAAARGLRARGAKIHVVHVIPRLIPSEPGVMWDEVDDASRVDHARAQLVDACAANGLEGSVVAVLLGGMGNPAIELVDYAADARADLIVVTSHGRTGLARFALGSVAERVVRHASCGVLVLRAT